MQLAKKEYNILLESGDLLDIFPELSGEWNSDKVIFEKVYSDYIKILNDMDVEFEDYNEGLLEDDNY